MSDSDKKITPREAAIQVLKKAEELYKASSLTKHEHIGWDKLHAKLEKEGKSKESADKIAGAIKAKVHPGKVKKSEDAQANPDEKADAQLGEQVEQDVQEHESKNADPGHEMPMKGHIKLAKFVGRMEHKRSMKKADGQTLGAAIGYPGAPATAPMPAPSPVAKSSK